MAELGESANPTDLVTSLRSGGDAAPERGFWDEVGEFFSGAGEGIGEFGKGLWDVGVGTVQAVGDLLSDPVGTVVQGVTNTVTHPVDFLKDVVAWDTWAESPGRALGQVVGGIALGGVVGKVLKGAGRHRDQDSDADSDNRPARTEEEKQ